MEFGQMMYAIRSCHTVYLDAAEATENIVSTLLALEREG
jgi:hypothetical protein